MNAVELLLTVAVLGLVTTVSIMALGAVSRGAQNQKAETDVKTLNAAITMYLSNGGDLDGVSTASELLSKLKTSRSKADKTRHVGAPSGKMIDPRINIRELSPGSPMKGAVFNSASKRFEIADSGERFEFILDDELNEYTSGTENRDHSTVAYAQSSSWVWDHAALRNPNAPPGPHAAHTSNSPVNSVPGTGTDDDDDGSGDDDDGSGDDDEDPVDPPDPPLPRLPTPILSKQAGGHPDSDFPLMVSVSNIPDGGDATVIYRTNGGAWEVYGGGVEIPMNTTLQVQFMSLDTTVFRDSNTKSAHYYPVPTSLNGTVDGRFLDPTGGPNLHYSLTDGGKTLHHGNPVYNLDGVEVNTGDPNVLRFTPGTISGVAPGEQFTLGTLFYHNGSSYYDSHATGGTLAISIDFTDIGEHVDLNINMDMVNTENDFDDLAASADYVRLLNVNQNIPLSINGVAYQIRLQFGATDSFGFSSSTQFHVYEGATGQGEILGTFLAAP